MIQIPARPLNEAESDWLDEILLEYGGDNSLLGLSDLDGYLTALVSGPQAVMPSVWMPTLWGGVEHAPKWKSAKEFQRFTTLVMQHMNSIVYELMNVPEQYQALFMHSTGSEPPVLIAEEWAFGYMRGVDLGAWPALPADIQVHLDAIALHGREENLERMGELSLEAHQRSIAAIEPAVRALHAYWLAQRSPGPDSRPQQPILRSGPKTGRNDPCPCGSGKKFKQCCLH